MIDAVPTIRASSAETTEAAAKTNESASARSLIIGAIMTDQSEAYKAAGWQKESTTMIEGVI